MMTKDKDGYIISSLPEDAYFLPGLENLVIPIKNGFPEYTPKAYNAVNRFFRQYGYDFDIDNLNDREWSELTADFEKNEILDLCKIAYNKENKKTADEIISNLMKKIDLSDKNIYFQHTEQLTVLDICIKINQSFIHIELPYCTIDKIMQITD